MDGVLHLLIGPKAQAEMRVTYGMKTHSKGQTLTYGMKTHSKGHP